MYVQLDLLDDVDCVQSFGFREMHGYWTGTTGPSLRCDSLGRVYDPCDQAWGAMQDAIGTTRRSTASTTRERVLEHSKHHLPRLLFFP